MAATAADTSLQQLKDVIARHWGFRTLRPLQEPAMDAVLAGRDSLVVLPTGGGKSLCYQAPAVARGEVTVVISPLISLMKDQVDSLRGCDVPAHAINSGQPDSERDASFEALRSRQTRLLFVSPERMVMPAFATLLQQVGVRTFAVDEAHCISHWGHDFRPEYRQLNQLRKLFPGAALHAYTATATQRVRNDIVEQLGLRNPEILVGNFDRPNLSYRIDTVNDQVRQVMEVLDRHKNEAGIIYCLRRKDVDELAKLLQGRGYCCMPYHAGLTPEQRHDAQTAFADEKCNLIVATIAFGMGIDRSNIRFVLHANMPKSVEHYQQETGRAGRDGLEAECTLLYSGADLMTWKFILEKSAEEPNVDPTFLPNALKHLEDMNRYCQGSVCRHKALVEYFGQKYQQETCQACDLCLGDAEPVPESQVTAQKILSCVARVKENFGVKHVITVLRGQDTEKVRQWEHHQLTTFGLLKDIDEKQLRDWIYQLIGQGVLVQTATEYPVLQLSPASWEVMKGQRVVELKQRVRREEIKRSKAENVSWEGVDRQLFETLRGLRKKLAEERAVPPYVILSDATLRELAAVRPSTLPKMRAIYGIGENKLRDLGPRFLAAIQEHCRTWGVAFDRPPQPVKVAEPAKLTLRPNTSKDLAYRLFREGAAVTDVMHQTERSRSTIIGYLCDFIRDTLPDSIDTWVPSELYERIAAAARKVGTQRLKPIYLDLNEEVEYDDIWLVVIHMKSRGIT